MAAEPIATIPVNGGRIAYRRLGSGRPLIVLNGLADDERRLGPIVHRQTRVRQRGCPPRQPRHRRL